MNPTLATREAIKLDLPGLRIDNCQTFRFLPFTSPLLQFWLPEF